MISMKENDKYERQVSILKIKLKYEQTNNTKLEKENNRIIRIIEKMPVTNTTNNNNNVYQDNSKKTSNYIIQFNQYFNNSDPKIAVNERINNELSSKSLINEE